MSLYELSCRAQGKQLLIDAIREAGPKLLQNIETYNIDNISLSLDSVAFTLYLEKLEGLKYFEKETIIEFIPGFDVWNPHLSLLQAIRTYF